MKHIQFTTKSSLVLLLILFLTKGWTQENTSLKMDIESYSANMKAFVAKEPCDWKKNDSMAQRYRTFVSTTLDKYGYPGSNLVGEETAGKFYGLITLPYIQSDLQKKGLELMKVRVEKKELNAESFARLADRISFNESGKQIYGTMVNMECATCKEEERKLKITPIAQPDKVDELRKSIGLSPMQDYLNMLTTAFKKIPVKSVIVQNPCKGN
jgi:hypothetical protein